MDIEDIKTINKSINKHATDSCKHIAIPSNTIAKWVREDKHKYMFTFTSA